MIWPSPKPSGSSGCTRSASSAPSRITGVNSSTSTNRSVWIGPTTAASRALAGTPRKAAAGAASRVIAIAMPSTSTTHDRFDRQSLPVTTRTASSRDRPMAVKAEPMKKTVPTKAAEVNASSMAPLLVAWPTSHGMARPGSTQRSRRSWMTSSSSMDRCTSPRQKATAPSQPAPCRLRAAIGWPTARLRAHGGVQQPAEGARGQRQQRQAQRLGGRGAPAPAAPPGHAGPGHDAELQRPDPRELTRRCLQRPRTRRPASSPRPAPGPPAAGP